MNELGKRIMACKTPNDLNSLRLLITRDKDNFPENQKLFKRKLGQLKRTPRDKRPKVWGEFYNPSIKQQED